jgi:hypothetical protein
VGDSRECSWKEGSKEQNPHKRQKFAVEDARPELPDALFSVFGEDHIDVIQPHTVNVQQPTLTRFSNQLQVEVK